MGAFVREVHPRAARRLLCVWVMISILRAAQHFHLGPADRGTWATFSGGAGLGVLAQLDEHLLPPGVEPQAWHAAGELLTYVHDGNVTCESAGLLQATEVQLVVDGLEPWRVRNRSKTDSARVFQLTFASPGAQTGVTCTQRRFTMAERREHWRLIASPDASLGSLLLLARACVYSSLLRDGFHVVHELPTGHAAWLHVVDGGCVVGETWLRAGDGASFTDERSVSLTARGVTELLLVEVFSATRTNGRLHHFDGAGIIVKE